MIEAIANVAGAIASWLETADELGEAREALAEAGVITLEELKHELEI